MDNGVEPWRLRRRRLGQSFATIPSTSIARPARHVDARDRLEAAVAAGTVAARRSAQSSNTNAGGMRRE
jgi:hypothetical protein